ncbi:MAG: hypothetical protein K9M96_16340 [Deltaproteobacteria bacterium]|nr:hypothetical protein [Deltaproteobacteria bacterium]
MAKRKRKPKRHPESRVPNADSPNVRSNGSQEVHQVIQYLGNELQKSRQLINAVRREHCQVRDGLIFLIQKVNEMQPNIEKELADYYATNHNLSGQIELNYYNVDKKARRAA